MSLILELPAQYGFVLTVATSTFFLNTLHVILTSQARKASGVKYPIAYASKEEAEKSKAVYLFNCTQRAHSNFTENQPSFLGALLIAGLRWPVPAAAIGAVWVFGRTMYAFGYSSKGPQGRTIGSGIGFLCDFALKGMAATAAITLALQ